MAYRNDFYTVTNIIGFSGDVRFLPTVYFQRGDEYGHITQFHNRPFNVGREYVAFCRASQYHVYNHFIDGRIHAIEWEGYKLVHVSRNRIIKRDSFRPGDLQALSLAIRNCPHLKPRYRHPGYEQTHDIKGKMQTELIRRPQQVKKNAMHAELLAQFNDVRNHRLDLFMPGRDRNPAATNVIDSIT